MQLGVLLKARKMPVGTLSHGRKKIAEGKWVPVSREKNRKQAASEVAQQAFEGEKFSKPPVFGYVFRGTEQAELDTARQHNQYLGQFWTSDPSEAVTAAGAKGVVLIAKQSGSVRLRGFQITGMSREQQRSAYQKGQLH